MYFGLNLPSPKEIFVAVILIAIVPSVITGVIAYKIGYSSGYKACADVLGVE